MKLVSLPVIDVAVMPAGPALAAPADAVAPAGAAAVGTVMAWTQGLRGYSSEHEQMTRMEVVRRLARLKGFDVSEEFAEPPRSGSVYLVPSDTLVGVERAQALGIRGRDDFFGGVVPLPFVSTKAITHPLVAPDAAAPEGWSAEFPRQVRDAVLPGYSVFSHADARLAGALLLALGPLRIKPVRETGGRGQTVAADLAALGACIDQISEDTMARDGLVIEQNLAQGVQTLSVGQVWVAGMVATYYGFQKLTRDGQGNEVYGGSDLTVVRGDFQALLALELSREVRIAVEQALVYDSAAVACFPGFMASRINYDVVQGLNQDGQWCSGVLEQSWRAGGATGCEIAALEAFQADPACRVVHARGYEIFGDSDAPPAGAVVYFRGVDPQVGPLTKYTVVSRHDAHTP